MIKRLRIRFVLTAIIAVFAVLLLLIGGINLFNYLKVVSDSDSILKILSDNDGKFPDRFNFDDGQGRGFRPPQGWDGDVWRFIDRDRMDSPELAFETRYFSVTVNKAGQAVKTDMGRIFAVSEDEAKEYAAEVVSTGKAKGFYGDFRYITKQLDGNTLVIFCDCTSSLANFSSFLKISLIISLAGLVLVSVIVFLISGRAIKPVAESYEKQKRFITDAGHEIKTPLAIINADADVLSMDMDEDNEWITDIKKQTSRLTELTNDLILLSKMEEGSKILSMEEVDLSSVMADQAESFKAVAVARDIRVICDVDSNIKIKGDIKSIEQLVSVLLDNAVKYCPDRKTVTAKLFRNGKNAVIEVTNDTEDDIPADTLRHLFDRFYRTDKSRNSATGGHGIGLSIASAIVAAHGGKISAAKKNAKKITFTAILPASA